MARIYFYRQIAELSVLFINYNKLKQKLYSLKSRKSNSQNQTAYLKIRMEMKLQVDFEKSFLVKTTKLFLPLLSRVISHE